MLCKPNKITANMISPPGKLYPFYFENQRKNFRIFIQLVTPIQNIFFTSEILDLFLKLIDVSPA